MTQLLSVDSARDMILKSVKQIGAERVSLIDSLDRVAAADITSPLDLPPFDNSAMDGYAIHHDDSADNPVTLPVSLDIMAGSAADQPLARGSAARIMTGAPIPPVATAVIPVEDTDDNWQKGESAPPPAQVQLNRRAGKGENIRLSGENIRRGATVISAGTVIGPAELGMLAGIGNAEIPVLRKPRVVILSSGDELVDIYDDLDAGKIRDSNSYTLAGLVRRANSLPLRLPIARDSLDAIRSLYRRALSCDPDLILSSAGVSVGAADLVRVVMDELGDIDFWRINMRPGKPLAFGTLQGVPFFGLPGNPVSVMVTFEELVRPALAKIGGRPFRQRRIQAALAGDMRSDGRRSYIRVKLSRGSNGLVAESTGIQSSGALMSMVLADGLAIIPEGIKYLPAGSGVQVIDMRREQD